MSRSSEGNNPFLGMLKAYDQAIEHYEFVIQDLSSLIYDSALQKSKQPVVDFLKAVQQQWKESREDVVRQVNEYEE